jgi:hypothetical protein
MNKKNQLKPKIMKTTALILMMVMTAISLKSQTNDIPDTITKYGIRINNFNTDSGFGMETEVLCYAGLNNIPDTITKYGIRINNFNTDNGFGIETEVLGNPELNNLSDTITKYGMRMINYKTNSGFTMETAILGYAELRNNSLGIGVFFNYNANTISGIVANYDWNLLNSRWVSENKIGLYVFYNFIFRVTTLHTSDFTDSRIGTSYNDSRVMSIEHYVGLGSKINIIGNVYLKAAAGYGLYLGSIKKASQPNENMPVLHGKNGWGEIVKFGIGYGF